MTDIDPPAAVGLRRRMVARLLDLGYVPAGWEQVLEAVPRQVFVPDLVWHPTSHGYLPLCRSDDPASWLALAYRDEDRIVAQVDDGTPNGIGQYPTCTVLGMSDITWLLGLITIAPGMRVCVIGAGLGYTTALLAHKLGADAVSAVELDPGLAADCRRRLDSIGLAAVDVLTGDGTVELPTGPPFDLILSTVTVHTVPAEWLRRVRPGGAIITGYGTTYCHDPIIRLQAHHAHQATGHVVGEIECERARGQRVRPILTAADVEVASSGADSTTLDVDRVPYTYDINFTIGIRVPHCTRIYLADDDHWYLDPTTESGAHWHRQPLGRYRVDQYGPRALWDEIDTAYHWWHATGRPHAGDWLITATPDGTTVQPPTTVMAAAG